MVLVNPFGELALDATVAEVAAVVRTDTQGREVALVGGVDFTDGAHALRTDPVGRLKISHAQPDLVVANLAAVNDALLISMESLSDAMIFMSGAAHAGYVVAFEYSPDTTTAPGYTPAASVANGTWYPVVAKNVGNATPGVSSSSGTLATNGLTSWELSAPAAVAVRARVTARTSGTLTVAGTGSTAARPTGVAIGGTVNLGTGGTGSTALGKAEDAAHASGDTGVAVWGVRAPTTPASQTSATGDYGAMAIDAEGKLITSGSSEPNATWQSTATLTTTTATAARAAQGAGIRTHVTDVTLANTSATAVRVDVLDGTTLLWSAHVPAGTTYDKSWRTPLRGTAATALNVQLAAAVTDVRVSLSGYSAV